MFLVEIEDVLQDERNGDDERVIVLLDRTNAWIRLELVEKDVDGAGARFRAAAATRRQ